VASSLCGSADLSSFYVGYVSVGVVEKYSVVGGGGQLVWSCEAHAGDVNTIVELRPGLLCSAGSDCRVRPLHTACSLPRCFISQSHDACLRSEPPLDHNATYPLLTTRSTQPCIPPGSLNRVPASAGVRAGMSPPPGGR